MQDICSGEAVVSQDDISVMIKETDADTYMALFSQGPAGLDGKAGEKVCVYSLLSVSYCIETHIMTTTHDQKGNIIIPVLAKASIILLILTV